MPPKISFALRLLLVLSALLLAPAQSAEPTPPLLGASRDQVVRRLGEPRSQLQVGNRLVMLYARERVVLRDGVVVEVERLAPEPVRRPVAVPATAAPAPAETAANAATAAPATPTPAAPVAAPVTVIPASSPAQIPPAAVNPENIQPPATDPAPTARVEPVAPAPEPKVEIKLIRPPSSAATKATAARPAAPPAPSAAPAASLPKPAAPAIQPAPAVPVGRTEQVARPPVAAVATPPPATAGIAAPPAALEPPPAVPAAEALPEAATRPAEEAAVDDTKARRDAAAKKAKVIQAARRRLEATLDSAEPDPTPSIFSTRTYIIAFITMAGGIGFLIWRGYQRRLELAATALSRTPFETPVAAGDGGGSLFSAELLGKLEWKRFEELVEAYYSKTGVVAQRTKGGPAVSAQVKISWKGEQRPFALVRCISHRPGLIEVKPLQELFTLLAAEDIRRGYVVSTSKFSVAARDYAEEKHLTLLSGDLFLEKLNALPEAARVELMQVVTAGDFATPSCPTCEAKMTADGGGWKCAAHPEVNPPEGG